MMQTLKRRRIFCARAARTAAGALGILMLVALAGCGGSGGGNSLSDTATISLSPPAVGLPTQGGESFVATVSGISDQTVTWTVQEGTAGGTITSAGFYTAPTTPGTYHVVATSSANLTISATATVTVTAPTPNISLAPTSVTLSRGETQTFAAVVSSGTDQTVTWSVAEGAAGGTITAAGAYTAPATAGTYHVVATSSADTSKTATAVVTVP